MSVPSAKCKLVAHALIDRPNGSNANGVIRESREGPGVHSPIVTALAACILMCGACSDTPATGVHSTQLFLAAASEASITGVVGTDVAVPPVVSVRDPKGAYVRGIVVTFAVVSGGGSISTSTVLTDSTGRASLTRWTLGTQVADNTVSATIGDTQVVTFRATTIPGSPASLLKIAGDNQRNVAGGTVAVRPKVRVRDGFDNPIAGLSVKFSVMSGRGKVSEDSVLTDLLGIATLRGWTLGEVGEQSIAASVPPLATLFFFATAYDPLDSLATTLVPEAVRHGELSQNSRKDSVGRFFELYELSLPGETDVTLRLTSASFKGRLEVQYLDGTPIAEGPVNDTSSNTLRALLPAGLFRVVVTSNAPGAVGQYDITYHKSDGDKRTCDGLFVVHGTTVDSPRGSGSCVEDMYYSTDRYRIYLKAGSTLSAILEDYSLSDNVFQLESQAGGVVAIGVAKDYVESNLNYQVTSSGYYVILVKVYEKYLLTIK